MRKQSGFTLIEAMIVVAIIGVLAAIGYSMLQRMLWKARANEVTAMFQGICAKEEAYFAEFHRYVSNGFVPGPIPSGNFAQAWPAPASAILTGFEDMGFRPDSSQVWHVYRVTACDNVALAPCINGPCNSTVPGQFPTGYTGAGFIIEAIGDVNNDGNLGNYCATSHSQSPIIWNNAEDWPGQADEDEF